jgi:hypothetical protein
VAVIEVRERLGLLVGVVVLRVVEPLEADVHVQLVERVVPTRELVGRHPQRVGLRFELIDLPQGAYPPGLVGRLDLVEQSLDLDIVVLR